jgi:hypothetical protein
MLTCPRQAPRLRIGVMLDSTRLPRVFKAVLEDVRASDFAELVTVIRNDEPHDFGEAPATGLNRYLRTLTDSRRRRYALFSAYEGILEPRLAYPNDPLVTEDCSDVIQRATVISVRPIVSKFVHRFPAEAIAAIRAENLDVIVRFGFKILRGEVLETARYGVWSYHHGDNEFYRGLPPGFWEMAEGTPVTGVVLQRLTEALDAGLVLARAHFSTHSVLSAARNRFGPYWGSRHFVIQKLRELHRDGWDAVAARGFPTPAYRGRRNLYRRPTNLDVLGWAARRVLPDIAGKLRHRGSLETWRIGLRQSSTPLYRESMPDLSTFTWTTCPKGRFWADPFLISHQGKPWVFFEDFDFATAKGIISCAPVEQGGTVGSVETVLERPYHLSYPSVFTAGCEIYMIPETSANGTIELYRARKFPFDWVLEKPLLHSRGLDTTVFQVDGRWWMLTTPDLGENHAAITLLYSAPNLLGPWTQHAASPVVTDVRSARSGGAVHRERGTNRLIRVGQNCAGGYGLSLCFSEILELNDARYRETVTATVQPNGIPGLRGVHTYNQLGTWEVVDGKWLLPSKAIL